MLQRYSETQRSVAVGTSVANSTVIPYGSFAAGTVFVPDVTANGSLTTLTWYAAEDDPAKTGTLVAVRDGAGNAVTSTIAKAQCCKIPDYCLGCRYLAITGNTTGTVHVSLKG